jgi:uncharacterized membrane protein
MPTMNRLLVGTVAGLVTGTVVCVMAKLLGWIDRVSRYNRWNSLHLAIDPG